MIVVFAIFGFVIALFAVMGLIDLKARRRGVRYSVGQRQLDTNAEINRAEFTLRSDMQGGGYGGGS